MRLVGDSRSLTATFGGRFFFAAAPGRARGFLESDLNQFKVLSVLFFGGHEKILPLLLLRICFSRFFFAAARGARGFLESDLNQFKVLSVLFFGGP